MLHSVSCLMISMMPVVLQAISRSNCRDLVMQSENFYKYLTVTKGLVNVRQIMPIVDEQHAVNSALFHHTDTFNVAYPHIIIAEKLRCLENFDRIDPLSHKCGVMLAKCTCMTAIETFAVSNQLCSVCSTAQILSCQVLIAGSS